jgi:hypothetical protein
MDDDERAMAKAAGAEEGEDEGDEDEPKNTVLLRQPTCVSGGAMRYMIYFPYGRI